MSVAVEAVCDIYVPRNPPSLSMGRWRYCGSDMALVDGLWVCPKHGGYVEACKTLPHSHRGMLSEGDDE